MGFPGGASGKETTCHCRKRKRLRFDTWCGRLPGRRQATHSSILFYFISFLASPSSNFILVYSTNFYLHFSGFDSGTFQQTSNESMKVNILKIKYTQKTRGIQMFRTMQKGWSGWCFHWYLAYLGLQRVGHD